MSSGIVTMFDISNKMGEAPFMTTIGRGWADGAQPDIEVFGRRALLAGLETYQKAGLPYFTEVPEWEKPTELFPLLWRVDTEARIPAYVANRMGSRSPEELQAYLAAYPQCAWQYTLKKTLRGIIGGCDVPLPEEVDLQRLISDEANITAFMAAYAAWAKEAGSRPITGCVVKKWERWPHGEATLIEGEEKLFALTLWYESFLIQEAVRATKPTWWGPSHRAGAQLNAAAFTGPWGLPRLEWIKEASLDAQKWALTMM